jgi:DNA polymerase V
MNVERILKPSMGAAFAAQLYEFRVPAGFPSPADDYMDGSLDLNDYLIQHPAATIYCRVSGDSMTGLGIFDGDLLIVDRAITAKHGDIVLAAVDGELACKVLDLHERRLLSANNKYPPLTIGEEVTLVIEGVVTNSIRQHRVCAG